MSDPAVIRRRTRWAVVALAAVLLVGLAMLAWGVTHDPIEAQRSAQSFKLRRLGLRHHPIAAASGPVWVWEGGQGPTLLLLHGFLADGSGWADVVPALLPHTHVVVLDLPGHGDSPPGAEGAVTWADWVQAVQAVADDTTDGMVVPVGHSLGALAALGFAAEHPDRVWKLVLVAPPADADPAALSLPDVEAARQLVSRMMPGVDDVPAFLAEALVRRRAEPRVQALVDSLAQVDPVGLAARVADPTWILRAPDDGVVGPDAVAALSGALADARVVALPACGHLPQTLCPDALADAILTAVLDPRQRR